MLDVAFPKAANATDALFAKKLVVEAFVEKKLVVVADVPVAFPNKRVVMLCDELVRFAKVAFVAKKFVVLAVVAKKLVVVAFVPVALLKSRSVILPMLDTRSPKTDFVEKKFVVVAEVPVALPKERVSVPTLVPSKADPAMLAPVIVGFSSVPLCVTSWSLLVT